MSDLSDIKKVVEDKTLTPKQSLITTQCMVELCLKSVGESKFENLGSLLESIENCVIVFDSDLLLFDMNKPGKNIIENYKDFLYDGKYYSLDKLPIISEVQITKKGSEEPIEIVSFDSKNKKRYFNAAACPIFSNDNDLIGYCLILDDVTKTKKDLEKTEDMISALTHDLKTPLVATDTSLKHVLEGYYGEINDDLREVLSAMKSSNFDALCLVRNLLSTLKYDSKDYNLFPEETSVSKLIEEVKKQTAPLMLEKELKLKEVCSDFQLTCDIMEIKRVLTNLITNAIKYSPKGSTIEIKAAKDNENNSIFKIKDYGKGIPLKDLPNLFDRFWKAGSAGFSTVGSTGLGLYLCKQIVDAHDGFIWAKSEEGKYTEIIFILPCA